MGPVWISNYTCFGVMRLTFYYRTCDFAHRYGFPQFKEISLFTFSPFHFSFQIFSYCCKLVQGKYVIMDTIKAGYVMFNMDINI